MLVVLAALTTAVVVAPVAVHRRLAGRHVKERLVVTAHRLVGVGLVCLGAAGHRDGFLIFDVVVDRTVAAMASGCASPSSCSALLVALPMKVVGHDD